MKSRRHHNNKGLRQIKRGRTAKQVELMARKVGVPYRVGDVVTLKRGWSHVR
jgi:hypothetical protein